MMLSDAFMAARGSNYFLIVAVESGNLASLSLSLLSGQLFL